MFLDNRVSASIFVFTVASRRLVYGEEQLRRVTSIGEQEIGRGWYKWMGMKEQVLAQILDERSNVFVTATEKGRNEERLLKPIL
jgi:hypothetical protein